MFDCKASLEGLVDQFMGFTGAKLNIFELLRASSNFFVESMANGCQRFGLSATYMTLKFLDPIVFSTISCRFLT